MTRRIFIQLILLLPFCISLFSQAGSVPGDRKTLLIIHPTVGNIAGISKLVSEGIFPVTDIQLKGVYYSKEVYDYSQSENYIKEKKLPVSLEKIEGDLYPENLFAFNPCSPAFKKLFNESVGIIFNGGPDIPPFIYGEKTSTLTVITDPYRHYFESSFLFHLLGGYQDLNWKPLLEDNPQYLVLGFCLGMQTMNIATGGTLFQDIPLEIYGISSVEDILQQPLENRHRNYETNISDSGNLFWGNIHPIKVKQGSWIINDSLLINSENPSVVSSHHQSVKKTGKGLQVAATSMDGKIIESLSHTRYPNVFGFQFHPEISDIYNNANSYQFTIGGERKSLRAFIEDGNGYDFHLALWAKFAEVINQNH